MSRIEEKIEVGAPISTVYNQWTQFEDFPRFMEGVDRVVQLDDTTLEWTATIAGAKKEWQARITEQTPDRSIAWVSTAGARNDGMVSFRPVGADRTEVSLVLDVEPSGAVETLGDAAGVVRGRVRGDLERFRDFIEQRGVETGAWRGQVPAGAVRGPARSGTRAAEDGGGTLGTPASDPVEVPSSRRDAPRDW